MVLTYFLQKASPEAADQSTEKKTKNASLND